MDYIRPILRKAPDHIIYHGFCNDLGKPNIDSIKNLEELLKLKDEISPKTKLTISLLFVRDDEKGMINKVNNLN